jgi:hypothetical protein
VALQKLKISAKSTKKSKPWQLVPGWKKAANKLRRRLGWIRDKEHF